MSGVAILRLKAIAARYARPLALGLALGGVLLLGAAGWTYANPPTTEVTDRTNEQTVRTELNTSAVTTGRTSMYGPRTKMEDQPVYLADAAPSLTLTQRTTVPRTESVHVDQELTLVYGVSHDGSVFWRESRALVDEETTTSTGTAVTNTSLDIRDVQSRFDELSSEVGQAGTVHVWIVVTTSYDTGRYAGELSETVSLQLTDSWYAVDGPVLERTHSTPETRRIPIPSRTPSRYLVPGALGCVLLGAAGVVVVGRRRNPDGQRLHRRLQERRYAEWISAGTVPRSLTDTTVSVDSLGDLVDVAIDTNGRVIHDDERDEYVVIDGAVVYLYCPDGFRFGPPE